MFEKNVYLPSLLPTIYIGETTTLAQVERKCCKIKNPQKRF